MSPGAQGSASALLMSWRPKITQLFPLAPIRGEGRHRVGSRSSCLPWSCSHCPNLCLCVGRRGCKHQILPIHHSRVPGVILRVREHRCPPPPRPAALRALSPAARISHSALLPGRCSAAFAGRAMFAAHRSSQQGVAGSCWCWQGNGAVLGARGARTHPPLGLGKVMPLGHGSTGWDSTTRPPPVQMPRDTRLVAEIPFISLNCVTSNTAGGRFSVDFSYWGLASTKPGRKNLSSCTENYCCSVCYLQERRGQRRGAAPAPRGKPALLLCAGGCLRGRGAALPLRGVRGTRQRRP